ncbi:hypothetical protein ES332_A11G112700v1 [Gossypium tomentosum]|uniref:Uncharacterized protein n=1 Tax=Gossypium tomentosum TaxID=34277 RepID=A0A5D2N9L0_GOSTO|nr:hypothetical protein ES332_A11G112700v1 [Gossypium tomentosum]
MSKVRTLTNQQAFNLWLSSQSSRHFAFTCCTFSNSHQVTFSFFLPFFIPSPSSSGNFPPSTSSFLHLL